MPGIPVVISTNGFGTPVKVVTSNAPLMTVAENGYGMPIVLSDNGAPFVVEGNIPLPVYDPLAAALFARMTVDPSLDRKTLVNDRIVAGKLKSFWAKLDALWVHAAHDAQAGRLNWLTGSYDCVPINNPSFTTDRGYMGDGSGSYLDTGFNPTTAVGANYTQNSGSLGIRSNTENVGTGSLAGFYDTAAQRGTTINPKIDNTNQQSAFRLNTGSAGITTAAMSTPSSIGMFVANRTGSTVLSGFRDGVKIGTSSAASVALANGNMRLGSINASSFRACQFSMGFIAGGLTDQEAQDVFDWFEPYRAAVGIA